MRFFSRPGPQAEQRSGADQPVGWAGLRRFFGFWRGGDTGAKMRTVGTPRQNRGFPKGGQRHPLGTRPCLQGVVCYTCWRGCRGKRGAVLYAPRFPRQENGLGFCDREGTKTQPVFRERRQVYKPPSPFHAAQKQVHFVEKHTSN